MDPAWQEFLSRSKSNSVLPQSERTIFGTARPLTQRRSKIFSSYRARFVRSMCTATRGQVLYTMRFAKRYRPENRFPQFYCLPHSSGGTRYCVTTVCEPLGHDAWPRRGGYFAPGFRKLLGIVLVTFWPPLWQWSALRCSSNTKIIVYSVLYHQWIRRKSILAQASAVASAPDSTVLEIMRHHPYPRCYRSLPENQQQGAVEVSFQVGLSHFGCQA